MTTTRRIGIVTEPGSIEIREVPLEPLVAGNARVRIDMNGICGTDVHYFYDPEIVEKRAPLTLGHEWVGTLVEMGPQFPRVDLFGEPIGVGDRVVALYYMCGQCYYCRVLHQPSLCIGGAELRPYSLPSLQGGIGDQMQIPHTSAIVKIPADMPNETATLSDPFAVALGAVERALGPGDAGQRWGMGPGKTVLVQGSGPIGILSVVAARLAGAAQIMVIGAPSNRLELCRTFGADLVVNVEHTGTEERRELILGRTPHQLGPDAVIETAGVPAAFEEGIQLVRRGGTFVEVGHFSHRGMAQIDPYMLCNKHIHLYGSWVYTYGIWAETASVLRSTYRTIDYPLLVTHCFPLEQAQVALETARAQVSMKAAIAASL